MELPRFTQEIDKRAIDVQLDAASRRAEAERARPQDEWLKRARHPLRGLRAEAHLKIIFRPGSTEGLDPACGSRRRGGC